MKRVFFSLCLVLASWCGAQDLLKEKDVSRIMQQILEMHLEDKTLTREIWQKAIDNYISQFDPYHTYLLAGEVAPYTNLSDTQVATLNEEYKKSDFNNFDNLNKLFQQSIIRSRKIRNEIESNKADLFQDQSNPVPYSETVWATTVDELKQRQQFVLKVFLKLQFQKYGEAKINQNKAALIKDYEDRVRAIENQYLLVDDKGHPLSDEEQQNLLSIRILKAMASALDAHTSFYEANEAYDIRVKLKKEIEGIGIGMQESSDGIKVTKIIPGSPAEKSGAIKEGDIILKVNGESVEKLPLEKVSELIHNSKSDNVKVELKRKGVEGKPDSTFEVSLKREIIPLNTDRVDTTFETFGNGIIGKLTLHSFYENENGVTSENDIRDAIKKLEQKGPLRGLILDLRDNSGGFLSQAVKVAGLFITNGVIVISKYSSGEEKFYRDVDGKVTFDGPLVVLVSKVTASAAEIVAQALQDYGVAVIVGDDHTYGKGTIQMQTVTDNRSSSYFKVTVGTYYTVSGKTPQKTGVKSDVIVPGHWNDIHVGEEYLNSVAPDKVSSAFADTLVDVSTDIKPWYLKYYVPSLQRREDTWRSILPTLKRNSEHRIANNKNYQFYLRGGNALQDAADEDDEWLTGTAKKKKNFGEDDLQLQEAVNVVKDMIVLHADSAR